MGLRADAEELIQVLESVGAGLADFQGSSDQMEYTEHVHRRLLPLVEELREHVGVRSDRSEILRSMAEIKEVMYEVSGAANKGEMRICAEGILDTFWKLSTIFQEQRYRDEDLYHLSLHDENSGCNPTVS